MEKSDQHSFFLRVATVIVDKRPLFFLLYIFAICFCLFSIGWVTVENDVTTYLPEDTETRQGIVAMNDNFVPLAMGRIMVSNITYEEALEIRDMIQDLDGIQMVIFDSTEDHYRNASALYDVNFSGTAQDPVCVKAMETIRENLKDYDLSVDTMVGFDEIADMRDQMTNILIVAVIIILLVLTLTSRSYAEVPVLLITFAAAALLNMGTNFIFPKISFVSDAVAVVLQLALAIDYAIILCHRFSDEHETKPAREACIAALSKAIPEISASSMTTIGGLLALAFMKFTIGLDLSMVLIKAIFLSLVSVFTLMPGLLMLFCPLIDKTRHKKLLPNITWVGKFAVWARRVVPFVFIAILVVAFSLSSKCPYCYSYNDVHTAKMAERQMAYFKIKDTFGVNNMAAIVVPAGNYAAEQAILEELEEKPQVKGTMGLAGIEAIDGYRLTDALTPRQFSELIGLDYEVAQALYSAYAFEHDQYGELLNGVNEYGIPLFDMFLFLKQELETKNISLSGEMQDMLDMLFEQMEVIQQQMQNENYTRMVVYLNLPEESEETFSFLTEMRDIIGKYYEEDYYVVGNSTSSRDLASSFAGDNLLISVLSSLLVILVLLFTFQSVGLPLLLIIVIQGSIWINFSFPTITNTPLYFLGYLIVVAIQMGANIDYAIVISSHYQDLKARMPHKQAMVQALNESFPTVFTSGGIMASAGLLIGAKSAQPVISIMGNCLGRGTIISLILVLGVLPSVLVLGDSIIERTRFKFKHPEKPLVDTSGTVRVKGRIQGYLNGRVDGEFDGVIHGDVHATVSSGGLSSPEAIPEEGGADHEN